MPVPVRYSFLMEYLLSAINNQLGLTDRPLNSLLINYYCNGYIRLVYHKDNEAKLDKDSPIVAFSTGADRYFEFTDDKRLDPLLSFPLSDNSLIVMEPTTQVSYYHRIKEDHNCHKPRISITARRLVSNYKAPPAKHHSCQENVLKQSNDVHPHPGPTTLSTAPQSTLQPVSPLTSPPPLTLPPSSSPTSPHPHNLQPVSDIMPPALGTTLPPSLGTPASCSSRPKETPATDFNPPSPLLHYDTLPTETMAPVLPQSDSPHLHPHNHKGILKCNNDDQCKLCNCKTTDDIDEATNLTDNFDRQQLIELSPTINYTDAPTTNTTITTATINTKLLVGTYNPFPQYAHGIDHMEDLYNLTAPFELEPPPSFLNSIILQLPSEMSGGGVFRNNIRHDSTTDSDSDQSMKEDVNFTFKNEQSDDSLDNCFSLGNRCNLNTPNSMCSETISANSDNMSVDGDDNLGNSKSMFVPINAREVETSSADHVKQGYDPVKRHDYHISNYDPIRRQEMYDPIKNKEHYDPSTRHENHILNYDPRKRHEDHIHNYDPSTRHEDHILNYDSSTRHEDHILNYDSSTRHEDHILNYDPSTRHEDHIRNYDPSSRHEDHILNYDPIKRHEDHVLNYDPSTRHEDHILNYDPSTRHEDHILNYDPSTRHEDHILNYDPIKRQEMYDPIKNKEHYDPSTRHEDHILNYDPFKRHVEYEKHREKVRSKCKEKKVEINNKRREKYDLDKASINEKRRNKRKQNKVFKTRNLGPDPTTSKTQPPKPHVSSTPEVAKRATPEPPVSSTPKVTKRAARATKTVVDKFKEMMQEFPTVECGVCQRLRFKEQTITLNESNIIRYHNLDEYLVVNRNHICETCSNRLKAKKVPSFAKVNGLDPGEVPIELTLNIPESMLIALRIHFVKIIILPAGGQKGMHGGVINVPVDPQVTCLKLPRSKDDSAILYYHFV